MSTITFTPADLDVYIEVKAKAAVAAEREACAQTAMATGWSLHSDGAGALSTACEIAARIKARGNAVVTREPSSDR